MEIFSYAVTNQINNHIKSVLQNISLDCNPYILYMIACPGS